MNIFAKFDENPAITLQVIKKTKRYGRTDTRADGQTDKVKTVYPLQTKFAGGITKIINSLMHMFNVSTLYRESLKLLHQKLW